ncbi:hypothetical protein MNBD_CHLOROFLEXI01-1359 [hydrothermal vent metagenome]|uniref:Uncharacterized protein n=1 Tax=hydrothermal vent metagenome TaxID=652676 RepID=A0A3B0UFP9_9ZZZZ
MSEDVFYKVSYVVAGGEHPGAIINIDNRPEVGEQVMFDGRIFEILEVMELMPPVGNFGFLHATCRFVRDATSDDMDEQ